MNKDKTTDSVNEGRYERLRDADIKKHGYTELAGRNDPKRAHVYKAQTRAIGRARRIAGIVSGSANARPENISNILSRSARQSAEKRFAGKPAPRTAPKNRNRKIITNSFNHGLDEAKQPIKQSKNILGAAARGAISAMTTPKPAGTSGTKHVVKGAVRNMARHIMDKFL